MARHDVRSMTEPALNDAPQLIERTFLVEGVSQVICLEPVVWSAFDEFCEREALTGELACARAALRVVEDALPDKIAGLLTGYFRDATACNPPVSSGFSEGGEEAPAQPGPALRAAFAAVAKAGGL